MEHTKGTFKDGNTGWKVDSRETNGVKGIEIIMSEDVEFINVYL